MNILFLKRFDPIQRLVQIRTLPQTQAWRCLNQQSRHQQQQLSTSIESNLSSNLSIQSKTECIEKFKLLSETFHADLHRTHPEIFHFETRKVIFRFPLLKSFVKLQESYTKLPAVDSVLEYVDRNLAEFSVKEKALFFRIFALMNSFSTDKQNHVLNKLEHDFYEIDLQAAENNVSLVDLINYRDGIYYHR